MTKELQAANDHLQQQVDELSEMVDLLQRAVAALQTESPRLPPSGERPAATCAGVERQIGPRDLHPSVPLTEGTRRHLLELAGGSTGRSGRVADVTGSFR